MNAPRQGHIKLFCLRKRKGRLDSVGLHVASAKYNGGANICGINAVQYDAGGQRFCDGLTDLEIVGMRGQAA